MDDDLLNEKGFDNEESFDEDEIDASIRKYIDLLPAWFSERMMTDSWSFGLLMITGDIIAIQYIFAISQDASGNLWLDAMLQDSDSDYEVNNRKAFVSPTSRNQVSINASHVMAAFELADT